MNWRDEIIQAFVPQVSPLTLVADPDSLLSDEEILSTLKARGFEVLKYTDPITFRYEYESKYVPAWEEGQSLELIVVVEGERLENLPFDLLASGRELSFSLAKLFPKLSYPLVSAMRNQLDQLYSAYVYYYGSELGERETAEFILKHVFHLDLGLIKTPENLLAHLIDKHYNMISFPQELDRLVTRQLQGNSAFSAWPLERIVSNREEFFRFLQEKWQQSVEAVVQGEEKAEMFARLRMYWDNLFLEGLLEPVQIPADSKVPEWMAAGVVQDPKREFEAKFHHLAVKVESLCDEAATYKDWQRLAFYWAELKYVFYQGVAGQLGERIAALTGKLDEKFTSWLGQRFGSLAFLPYTQAVMQHHIPNYLAHNEKGKIALVVVDGLALDQWLVIKNYLKAKRNWLFEERATFAWIPTLTSVCRQALFSGRLPLYFQDSINTTAKEEKQWQNFWDERRRVLYLKGLGSSWDADLKQLDSEAEVLGLVVKTVDEIMHGMKLGTRGMHQQIQLWLEGGYLLNLIDWLLKHQYAVYLTSDHGNIEATGTGRLTDGTLAESRGLRARIYQHKELLERAREDNLFWPGAGLPQNYHVLIAKGRTAFAPQGEKVISHGGITLEEVLVPFVKIGEE